MAKDSPDSGVSDKPGRQVSSGLLLGLLTFAALLMFASAYLVDSLAEAEAGAARVAETELSSLGAFYVSTAGYAYFVSVALWVGVVLVTSGCRKRQRLAIAGAGFGLIFSLLWHIGARMAF